MRSSRQQYVHWPVLKRNSVGEVNIELCKVVLVFPLPEYKPKSKPGVVGDGGREHEKAYGDCDLLHLQLAWQGR